MNDDDTGLFPDRVKLEAEYNRYAGSRELVSRDLALRLEDAMRELPSRISVKVRAKDFLSYYKKYLRLCRQNGSGEPVVITDQIGIRIVCPFIEDLGLVEEIVSRVFTVIEVERKGEHQTFKEFGYQSIHILIAIPEILREKDGFPGCDVAEIQIRTILQDAWAEVEHELVYKAEFTPFDEPMKRKLAAVNASLSLADIIFQEIRTYQRQLNGELEKRRESFYKKIEESTDALIFDEMPPASPVEHERAAAPFDTEGKSIDDLLLAALSAHNGSRFREAIVLYSRMLEMNPGPAIASLIYKHRGMAYFAQSQYGEAIADFTEALERDPDSYKAAYYRGIVRVVLEQYAAAIEDFTRSLAIHPYQSFCFFRRSQAWYHLGDFPQALADCESAIILWPESPSGSAMEQFRAMLRDKLRM
ncbi:MAG: tetratricopeptide repeat protein [Spirochaetaceae bacterium]|jgi:putative GTP pyrophosphokinase|nr:tetratricopeptide repeat protein [Spirochaetaceae bacterium]